MNSFKDFMKFVRTVISNSTVINITFYDGQRGMVWDFPSCSLDKVVYLIFRMMVYDE